MGRQFCIHGFFSSLVCFLGEQIDPGPGLDSLPVLPYQIHMHEVALAESILDIAREEAEKHNARRLILVRVRCGALAQVEPEALRLAFESLARTMDANGVDCTGARLELIVEPLRLQCGECGLAFAPVDSAAVRGVFFAPCPSCGAEFGHTSLSGRGQIVEKIEAE